MMIFCFQAVITKYEKAKSQDRLKNAMGNNIWEYRKAPPADWIRPLIKDDPDAIYFMDDETPETVGLDKTNIVNDKPEMATTVTGTQIKTESEIPTNTGGRSCVIS